MALRCINNGNNSRCSGTVELRGTRADGDLAAFEGREGYIRCLCDDPWLVF
jgi:hypothetical protein